MTSLVIQQCKLEYPDWFGIPYEERQLIYFRKNVKINYERKYKKAVYDYQKANPEKTKRTSYLSQLNTGRNKNPSQKKLEEYGIHWDETLGKWTWK